MPTIRPLHQDDFAQWLPLWQAYQAFYKVSISEEVTAKTWSRFFEEMVPMQAFVAEEKGTLIGMVHYPSLLHMDRRALCLFAGFVHCASGARQRRGHATDHSRV